MGAMSHMIKTTKDYLTAIYTARSLDIPEIDQHLASFEEKKIKGRKGDWIPTYSGGMFWLADPRPSEVHIEDIAHALSMICRYNGHINQFYSVAQHSVTISEHCHSKYALFGLLHDATEAYIGDVISPLKKMLVGYKEIEENIMKAIAKKFKFSLTEAGKKHVKKWDNVLLATEVRYLVPYKYVNWKLTEQPLGYGFPRWSPEVAEEAFLKRFRKLYGKTRKRKQSVRI